MTPSIKDWKQYSGITCKTYSVYFDSSSGSWALFKGRKFFVKDAPGFIEALREHKVPRDVAEVLAHEFVSLAD